MAHYHLSPYRIISHGCLPRPSRRGYCSINSTPSPLAWFGRLYIEVTEVNVVLSIPQKFFPCPPTSKSRLLALLDSLSTALSARMRDDLFDLLDPDLVKLVILPPTFSRKK